MYEQIFSISTAFTDYINFVWGYAYFNSLRADIKPINANNELILKTYHVASALC